MTESEDTLAAIAYGEGSVLETLTDMNLSTLEQSGLDERTYTMVRIAALAAMGAPPVSYAMSLDPTSEMLPVDDLQGLLVALAPVLGSARTAAAASNVLDVFFVEDEDAAEEDVAEENVADEDVADEDVAETEPTQEAADDTDEHLALAALEEPQVFSIAREGEEEPEDDEREREAV